MNKLLRACVGHLLPVLAAGLVSAPAQASTDLAVTDSVAQAGVRRFGVGLAQHNYYDSAQMMRELLFRNPGFEGLLFRSVVRLGAGGTASSAIEDQPFTQWPSGYWDGASYELVRGGVTLRTGNIQHSLAPARAGNPNDPAGSAQGTTYQFADADAVNVPAAGDTLFLRKRFGGAGYGAATGSWMVTTTGGAEVLTETTDLPPGTPGTQCVRLVAPSAGQEVRLRGEFDTTSGFVALNGRYRLSFQARGAGGLRRLDVTVTRGGTTTYLSRVLSLGTSWARQTFEFDAAETTAGLGSAAVQFVVPGGSEVLLDDVSLRQIDDDPSNPTEFRAPIVAALRELRPGILRYVNWQHYGMSLDNDLAPVFARLRSGYSVYSTGENNMLPGLHEFLVLCEHVGAEPWYSMPSTFTVAEAAALVEYLAGPATSPYGAVRAARGRTAPWTDAFARIHLEFGNENWNNTAFRGGVISDTTACGGRATQVFAAVKSSPHYSVGRFLCVLGGQAGNPLFNRQLHNASSLHDHFTVAPYMSGRVDTFQSPDGALDAESLFGALFAEPEWWSTNPSPTSGLVAQTAALLAGTSRPVPVSIYEVNLHTTEGAISQSALDAYTPSVGAGIAVAGHMLTMLRTLGLRDQVFFSLAGHRYTRSDQKTAALWGASIDYGVTHRRRPHYFAQRMLNSALSGDLLATVHTGDNPTWNVVNTNRVTYTGAHYLQSFAFADGETRHLVVFNYHRTAPLEITFSGPNAPAGRVSRTLLTSAAITDSNETSALVAPVETITENLDPAAPLSLPPFSMTLLSWTRPPVQAWRYAHFGTTASAGVAADAADPDGDGLPNLLEYALAREPLVAGESTTGSLFADGPGNRLELVFQRARAELTYTVEGSDDLVTWTPVAVNPGTVGALVRTPDSEAPVAGGARFLRLRVSPP